MSKKATSHIILPQNPFWEVFKRFGRDEIIALIFNTIFTAIAAWFMTTWKTPQTTFIFVIAFIGPVVEKFGFYPAHFWEARKEFKLANPKLRGSFKPYFKRAIKRGSKSLIQDILIHDPIYILLMFLGITMYAQTPVWILALLSFAIAVVLVAALEVAANEFLYYRLKKKLNSKGFEFERYFEARFLIDKSVDVTIILNKLKEWFNLKHEATLDFSDTYYRTKLPSYGNRTPKLRVRSTKIPNDKFIKDKKDLKLFHEDTLEVVYTKAGELTRQELSQYRFFSSKKDKFFMPYDSVFVIDNFKVEAIIDKFALDNEPSGKVKFTRHIVYDPETLLISVDCPDEDHHDSKYYLLELKVFPDDSLLKAAMHYIMYNFPVLQTTHGKSEILKK